ncbi:MAG: pyridoxal phosphate-dependent aminotransferase [SAR202 cluster bacterium]|jgi:aspartate aminotransferase|nr:MAG: pyridoxal phosphate-dependent aminotransferase [SAR202 cluster bacterium]|tara:strand:- start:251 stop:1447 length:1197 start_codon:yes stop_codon:yes gene_type:complete
MSKKFSNLVEKIKPSFTLQMTARAAELRAQGEDVINFGVGEPDFNTPDHIIEAGKKAMVDGYTKYTPGSGMLELKEAIQTKLKDLTGINYNPENIIVSNGGKQSLSVVCQALFDSGDKVVVFSPYWVSFPEFVTIAGAEPLFVNTIPTKQFEPDFDDLLNKIDESVKGVIINSPSNPTGGVWSDDAIIKLLKLSKENNWIVISDETYEELVYDNEFKAIETLDKHNCEIITIRSMSKTYAMTGWRIGYTTADSDIVKAMSKIQGQTTSCPNAIGQRASIAALLGDQQPVKNMKEKFRNRRTVMFNELNSLKHVQCDMPGGAFYMFPDFSYYLNKKNPEGKILQDTFDLSDYILADAKVVTVAGDGFGASGYLRFSFATNKETIIKGIQRIRKSLEKLK